MSIKFNVAHERMIRSGKGSDFCTRNEKKKDKYVISQLKNVIWPPYIDSKPKQKIKLYG